MSSEQALKILIVDDEEPIRRFLRAALEANSFKVIEAETGQEGIRQTANYQPDILLLDLGLPDIDGIEIIKQVREWSAIPIIILSARGQEDDKVKALEAGADDYVTKPFSVRELLARISVAVRRQVMRDSQDQSPIFTVGTLEVDLSERRVRKDGVEIHLTPIEYKILVTLVCHAGKVVTHRQLLQEIWGPARVRDTHYLRIYMGHLRHKLEKDPTKPEILLTEPGVGYRLQ